MPWKNTKTDYGWLSKSIHGLSILVVFGLFALGLWMQGFDYYHTWYRTAPYLHKSIGILLFVLTVARLIWVMSHPKPLAIAGSPRWEQRVAHIVHTALYLLLFAIMLSGYLISTADGRGIAVFNWIEIPALPWALQGQEDIAGDIHKILAFSLMGLVVLHALAALKHHFISRDRTLRRMFF